ncbi:hypothetical protein SAMN05443432_101392 [Roseovarius litoreus]|jgi:hypothetical protein|uniref:DUF2946 domain-containing protein n=1 Tax=Roseovarius litoreus TaxID=1155722 RepID=A0A1M7AC82_9RHOB|nr:hypothetical protein [Roseovarius litoreus]SHL40361.1 hypothetical protein SAMN05443432_101392 [Roseovarius litoreus]
MTRRERQDRTGLRGLMAVLLGLVLMLRLIAAPIVVSAPHPDVIAICSGGGVYYITLDGEPVGGDVPESDPCPYLGIPLALAGLAGPVLPPAEHITRLTTPASAESLVPGQTAQAYGARAPPVPA